MTSGYLRGSNNLLAGASAQGGYTIEESLRFNASQSSYLSWTPASAGNRKTWTWSGWVKRGKLGTVSRIFSADDGSASTDQDYNSFFFNSSDQLQFGGNLTNFRVTTAVYRDPSSWYHIVLVTDTTQATSANRFKLYVNGVEVTAFGTANNPSQNTDLAVNATIGHYIGAIPSGNYLDGYLTEVNFIDGQALDASSFGETDAITGVWKPKKYTGTYGTNGFFLDFRDASTTTTLGYDYSGNSNNWTLNNFSLTGTGYCSMTDTPTPYLGGGNYAVLNPLSTNAGFTLSNANLDYSESGAISACRPSPATIAMSSGKWYWEVNTATVGGGNYTTMLGIWDATSLVTSYTQNRVNGYAYATNGDKVNSSATAAYGSAMSNGDVIGIAFNADSGTIEFFKNNTNQGTAFTGISGSYVPVVCFNSGITSYSMSGSVNFGQRPFAYTPPTGFKALHTGNLPDSTIVDGSKHFDVTLYIGNGSTQSIVNSGSMQPDLVWVKGRSTAYNSILANTVAGITNFLNSNTTNAESNTAGVITSVNADGFSVGSSLNVNQNAATHVAWQWKANGTGVSNTDGSITSTVSANPTAGFSVVTWTADGSLNNQTGHGLGVAPKIVIYKNRTTTSDWWTLTTVTGSYQFLRLNLTNAAAPQSGLTISSTTIPNWNFTNGNQVVAYCFAEVEGFSKMGTYVGNGSTDGTFVYCGFRPAFVMVKRTDATGNWRLQDTARNEYNTNPHVLFPNLSDAEGTGSTNDIDILSNGFKLRNNSSDYNASGGTYIFAAFSETDFANALAR